MLPALGIAGKVFGFLKDKAGEVITDSKERRAFEKQVDLIRAQHETELAKLENSLEVEVVRARRDIIVAETKVPWWTQLRGIAGVSMLAIIALHAFGFTHDDLTPQEVDKMLSIIWTVLGGYIGVEGAKDYAETKGKAEARTIAAQNSDW